MTKRAAAPSRSKAKKNPSRAHDSYAANDQQESLDQKYAPHTPSRNREPLAAKTEAQRKYLAAIRNFTVTFGVGPAGTGKTYIAAAFAAQALEAGEIDKIIITRPAVEAGESMGFLPGELDEKYEPYLTPLREVFNERLGRSQTEYLIKTGRIEAVPLAFMRGRTFRDSFVLLDEAQNVTRQQMKLFLTRIGENCKVVVDGDVRQSDLKEGMSGLEDALRRLKFIPSIKVVTFTRDDIVRSGLVQEIVQSYEEPIPSLDLDSV